MIIGRIEKQVGDEKLVVELDDSLEWHSSDSSVVDDLSSTTAIHPYSPADGYPGKRMLAEAAKYLNGVAFWLVPDFPEEPGRVY